MKKLMLVFFLIFMVSCAADDPADGAAGKNGAKGDTGLTGADGITLLADMFFTKDAMTVTSTVDFSFPAASYNEPSACADVTTTIDVATFKAAFIAELNTVRFIPTSRVISQAYVTVDNVTITGNAGDNFAAGDDVVITVKPRLADGVKMASGRPATPDMVYTFTVN